MQLLQAGQLPTEAAFRCRVDDQNGLAGIILERNRFAIGHFEGEGMGRLSRFALALKVLGLSNGTKARCRQTPDERKKPVHFNTLTLWQWYAPGLATDHRVCAAVPECRLPSVGRYPPRNPELDRLPNPPREATEVLVWTFAGLGGVFTASS